MAERRAGDDGDRRTSLGELARETLDAAGRNAGDLFHLLGRVLGEARTPSLDEPTSATGARRLKLRRDDDVREPERQHTFGPRPDWHPFVGVGTGLRHARLDLHERAADAGAALSHEAVALRVRDR